MAAGTANRAWLTQVTFSMDQNNRQWFTATAYYIVGSYSRVVAGAVTTDTETKVPSLTQVGFAQVTSDAASATWGADNDGQASAMMDLLWTDLKNAIISQENLNVDGNAIVYNVDNTVMT